MGKRLGDRREHLRFDVSGRLWASLDVSQPVVLHNIGVGGALIEAKVVGELSALRSGQLTLRDRGPDVDVLIRHTAPLEPHEGRFLIGLEFINVSPATRACIDAYVQDWTDQAHA